MTKEDKLREYISKDFKDWIKQNAPNNNEKLAEAMIEMSAAYCRSEAAREYWKETLQEESKQNAIDFAEWISKNEYYQFTIINGDKFWAKDTPFARTYTNNEIYDLFIKHKEESK